MGELDNFKDDSFDDLIDSHSYSPNINSENQFKIRNDPKDLLERYKLSLMNAVIVETVVIDPETGKETKRKKVKFIKGTKPICNKQGQQGIITYLERFINNHTVQGNIPSMEDFNNYMRYVSTDLICHYISNRKDWGMSIRNIDKVISTSIHEIHIFLTRTLFNEERKLYGESFKETTSVEKRPENKASVWQKMGSFLGGGNKGVTP